MDVNRKTVFLILRDIEDNKAYSNIAANVGIARNKVTAPSFVRELLYDVLRNKWYLDFIISGFVKTPIEKMDTVDLTLIRMGLAQIIYMDSVPEYAAVNETVNLAKKYARGRKGFINGVLRQYLRDKDYISIPERSEDEIQFLSIKYSYQPWIVKMLIADYGIERAESLLEAGNKRPNLTVRANSLRTHGNELADRLRDIGFKVSENKKYENLMDVKGDKLIDNSLYTSGLYSIQDEAAYTAVKILDPQPGEYIVDVCAAPGGKTMAVAETMKNFGKIVAIDLYKNKLQYIDESAKRLGISIVESWSWDATRTDPDLENKADRVLCDVPCSGIGTVRKKPEIKYKEWEDGMESLPEIQLDILVSSSRYVKKGGILVYSTCTILNRENEDVVKKFLRFDKDFERVETKKLLPDTDGTDGFFICKMRRKETLV